MAPPEENDSSRSTEFEEFDPTSVEPDVFEPDSIGPRVDIPEPPDPTENDVSPELRRAFWSIVLMANVGLLGLSVGAMYVVFRGELQSGLSLIVLGVVALLVGYGRYREQQNR